MISSSLTVLDVPDVFSALDTVRFGGRATVVDGSDTYPFL